MRLVDFGCGEIVDRLTILALKILFGEQAGKDVKHFQAERAKLLTKLQGRTLNGAWFEHVPTLAAVNAALWHAEDDLRALRVLPDAKRAQWSGSGPTYWEEVGQLAVRIQDLNDQRASLVSAINDLTGEKSGAEKHHDTEKS